MPSRWTLLGSIPDDVRSGLLARCRRQRFAARQALFHAGDPGTGMHLIAAGRVAVRLATPSGEIATLAVFGPQEAVGEQSLLTEGGRRSATAVALEAVETLFLTRSAFDELRATQPGVDRLLVAVLEDRLRRTTDRLVEALYLDSPARVLRRVAEAAAVYGGEGVIPLTQEDIATMAGTTRPTVNRVLKRAQEAGAVRLARGRIEVVDLGMLGRLPG
jgi:CRP/FNR family transcriptional regulator, cyclic AMP receptor protein